MPSTGVCDDRLLRRLRKSAPTARMRKVGHQTHRCPCRRIRVFLSSSPSCYFEWSIVEKEENKSESGKRRHPFSRPTRDSHGHRHRSSPKATNALTQQSTEPTPRRRHPHSPHDFLCEYWEHIRQNEQETAAEGEKLPFVKKRESCIRQPNRLTSFGASPALARRRRRRSLGLSMRGGEEDSLVR